MIPEGPLDGLASALVLPRKSGIYITKSEMLVLARVADGSLRVNERRRMLSDVLKSADSLQQLASTFERLQEFCRLHLTRYEELQQAFPAMEPYLKPWHEAATRTLKELEGLRGDVADAASEEDEP